VFATSLGQVKKTALSEYDKSPPRRVIAINLREGDELVRVVATSGDDDLFEVTRNGMTIPLQRGGCPRHGPGCRRGAWYPPPRWDAVVSLDVAADDTDILIVTDAATASATSSSGSTARRVGAGGCGGSG